GQKTGIDLSGEAIGLVRHTKKWSAISVGAFSMGQEVGVTAIQMARMLSAIGNGGFLVVPHCVSEISDSSGKMKMTVFQPPQALTIRHSAIRILQDLLIEVVETGTGKQAKIPGYSVAGKTGTAQKIGPSRTYADGGHVASFVGYAPAVNPAFSMIVVLDDPKYQYHGGDVAAPLFRKIGQQVLKYLDIPPDQVLDVPALQAEVANPQATQAVIFPGSIEPAAYTPPEQHHKLAIALDDSKASGLVMPLLYGKTVGETIEILSRARLPFRLLGTGTVVKQWPTPGMLLNNDDLCIITLANSGEDSTTVADLDAKRR
ncbi:MAG TPA: penicillin-binding transpeptidase domain-containing protein, partial [Acidobacteriota bacterium]|nr:penicillin-binding transpeptidase domain-containing protein [Acidobacteriota bacterium]